MNIGLQCYQRQDQILRLGLIKVCPYCGEENDIGTAYGQIEGGAQSGVIPLCFCCEKPLWLTKEVYFSFGARFSGFQFAPEIKKRKRKETVQSMLALCEFLWS
jgi:hypothetical protein